MSVVAVLPVAGFGSPADRVGSTSADGDPLVVRALHNLFDSRCVDSAILVTRQPAAVRAALPDYEPAAWRVRVHESPTCDAPARELATATLPAAGGAPDVLLVHDSRRALTPASVIASVVAAVRAGAPEVVPVIPVTDTVKRVAADGAVTSTVDRGTLRQVQAPWGFSVEALLRGRTAPPHTVPGHVGAMKITTSADLAVAESVTATITATGAAP